MCERICEISLRHVQFVGGFPDHGIVVGDAVVIARAAEHGGIAAIDVYSELELRKWVSAAEQFLDDEEAIEDGYDIIDAMRETAGDYSETV
jgi:hypothetical protein